MGPTDAECVKACIRRHDAKYVLLAGEDVYELSDQQAPEKFAAQRVRVVGTLDAKSKTIRVESIADCEARPAYSQASVMQIDSSVRPIGGAGRPLAAISLRSSSPASGCAIADCTPTRTSPSA